MATREHISVVVVSHADAGKSTLTGHLIDKCGRESLPPGLLFAGDVRFLSHNKVLASTTERVFGFTMDLAMWRFNTNKYFVTIIDTPGRSKYLKNTLRGISQADKAILVISASFGEYEESKACGKIHEMITAAYAFGITQIIIAVNKMDDLDVAWSEIRFNKIVRETAPTLHRTGFKSDHVWFVPISGYTGDNLAEHSINIPWYTGPTLCECIDLFSPPVREYDKPFCMPILTTYKIGGIGLVVVGRVASGSLSCQDCVTCTPPGIYAEVKSIQMHHEHINPTRAGDFIGINVRSSKPRYIKQGCVVTYSKQQLAKARTQFEAKVCIINHPGKIQCGYTPVLSCHTKYTSCRIEKFICKIDELTGEIIENNPKMIKNGECALMTFVAREPICVEPFRDVPALGRFVLWDMEQIIGVGVVTAVV